MQNKKPPSAPQVPTTSKSSKSTKSMPRIEVDNEAFIAIPPDGGWGWVVVFAAFYCFCVADGALVSFGVFLNDMADGIHCSNSQISIAGAVQTCCYCLAGPISAALVNRFGYRVVVMSGAVLASIAYFLTSLTDKLYQIIITYGIMSGTGFGMMYVAGVIAVGYYFERWRGLASGISLCGAGIGATCLPPINTILLARLGWRDTFKVLGGIILSCLFCGLLFRPLKPVKVRVDASSAPKKTLSHISEVQETKSKMSQFFLHYNNATYPTVADVNPSVIALLRPPKLAVTRSASSEIIASTLLDGADFSYPKSEGDGVRKKERCRCCRACCSKCCYMKSYCCKRHRVRRHDLPSRPLYRDDIFYAGSIATLPEYKKSQSARPATSVQ